MSEAEHGITSAPPHGTTAGSSPFSDAEIAAFREDDKKAATNFVGLMLGIFILGVVLYLIVAYICAQ